VSRVLVQAEFPRAAGLSALLMRWRPCVGPFNEIIKSVPLGELLKLFKSACLIERADSRTGRWGWKFYPGMCFACTLLDATYLGWFDQIIFMKFMQ
jgi:hypothetical protein